MFKNMRVATKLGLGFGSVVALLVLATLLGIMRMSAINSSNDVIVDDRYPKIVDANIIKEETLNQARLIRDLIILDDQASDQKNLALISESRERRAKAVENLQNTVTAPKALELLARINSARELVGQRYDEIYKLMDDQERALAYLYSEIIPANNELLKASTALADFQAELMEQSQNESTALFEESRMQLMIIGGVAALISVLLAWLITHSLLRQLGGEPGYAAEVVTRIAEGDLRVEVTTRNGDTTSMLAAIKSMSQRLSQIISEVRSSADALTSASEEISATAQSMSQAASEQAASVEETSASMEQMSASISQNTENARITDGMASKASGEAGEGGQAVKETVRAMKTIADKIGIVDDIAYQTNLLALNAAIEAARAGEHGRGFAVVADEVRSLASRTARAADDIRHMVEGLQNETQQAVSFMEEGVHNVDDSLRLAEDASSENVQLHQAVESMFQIIQQLNQRSLAYGKTIEQVNQSSSEMRQTAVVLQSSAETVKANASKLQKLVGQFEVSSDTDRAAAA